MIGERREIDQIAAGGDQRALDLPGFGDAGETQLRAGRGRSGGLQPGDEDGTAREHRQQFGIDGGQVGGQQHDHGVCAGQAGFQRFAHRARREDRAVAEGPFVATGLAVDDDEAEGFLQGRVLVGVVQNQDPGSGVDGGASPGEAVACDPGGRALREHQGFVADVGGGVAEGIDPHRPLEPAAIAARQGVGLDAGGAEQAQDFAGDRGLAGPADGQIADGDDRYAEIDGRGAGDAPRGSGGPEPRGRFQHGAGDAGVVAPAHIPPAGRRELHGRPRAAAGGSSGASVSHSRSRPAPASTAARRARSPMTRAAAGSASREPTTPGRSAGEATTTSPPAVSRSAVTTAQPSRAQSRKRRPARGR